MENTLTSFDIHKIMVRAYQDSNVTAVLFEMIYDYFNNTSGIAKTKYDDVEKSIEIVTKVKCDNIKTINDLRQIHASFVLNTLREPTLQYLLSADENYKKTKDISDYDILYMACPTATILNITPTNVEGSVFKINLIN